MATFSTAPITDVRNLADRLEKDGTLHELSLLLSNLRNDDADQMDVLSDPILDNVIIDWDNSDEGDGHDGVLNFDFSECDIVGASSGSDSCLINFDCVGPLGAGIQSNPSVANMVDSAICVSECCQSASTAKPSADGTMTDPALLPEMTRSTCKRHSSNSKSSMWDARFEDLKTYREAHGDCLVPYSWPANPALAQWVKRMRFQHKQLLKGAYSTLTPARVEALESLGFVWDSHRNAWDERYGELVAYYEANGNCNVPSSYSANPKLALWMKVQKRQFRKLARGEKSPMTCSRLERLKLLGFGSNC